MVKRVKKDVGIPFSTLVHPLFQQAFLELSNSDNITISTSYELLKISEAVFKAVSQYTKLRDKIISNHAEKDESGLPKLTEDKTSYVIAKDKRESFLKNLDILEGVKVKIPRISMSLVKDANLSVLKLKTLIGTVIDPSK